MKTRILSADDTRTLVRRIGLDSLMDQLIEDLEEALRGYDPGRTDISTGWALGNQVVLDLFMRHARDLRLGSETEIEYVSAGPHDPYRDLHTPVTGVTAARGAKGSRETRGAGESPVPAAAASPGVSAPLATRRTGAASS